MHDSRADWGNLSSNMKCKHSTENTLIAFSHIFAILRVYLIKGHSFNCGPCPLGLFRCILHNSLFFFIVRVYHTPTYGMICFNVFAFYSAIKFSVIRFSPQQRTACNVIRVRLKISRLLWEYGMEHEPWDLEMKASYIVRHINLAFCSY